MATRSLCHSAGALTLPRRDSLEVTTHTDEAIDKIDVNDVSYKQLAGPAKNATEGAKRCVPGLEPRCCRTSHTLSHEHYKAIVARSRRI